MDLARTSGVLLHPTSLPGRYGIGDLGEAAYRFLDFLAGAGQTLWQVLPLCVTGEDYGNSPYQSLSAMAGNPLLISLEDHPRFAHPRKLLPASDLASAPEFPRDRVDFPRVTAWKMPLLHRAYERFREHAGAREAGGGEERDAFEAFTSASASWLDDFALFMALRAAHEGRPWSAWEPALRARQPAALREASTRLAGAIEEQKYFQYLFFRQWSALKASANERGIRIIGDVPIFVGYDSADVWSNPDLFDLDSEGRPASMAGVPPDYFSKTGQLWGNPHYRWDAMEERGYDWWLRRFRTTLQVVDITRIDHFRGFEAYWSVPAGETTAVNGHWAKGPGRDFFLAVRQALGDLPVIAEDLGLITADVLALRDAMEFPGMKVLQFAFSGDPHNEYLPHNYTPRSVVYTGTHDNDTTVGWFTAASEKERAFVRRYTGRDGSQIHWDLLRLAFGSTAFMAVAPLQDVLGLGSEARMNVPGRAEGNWAWRFEDGALTTPIREQLQEITFLYGRGVPPAETKPEHRRRHHTGHAHTRK